MSDNVIASPGRRARSQSSWGRVRRQVPVVAPLVVFLGLALMAAGGCLVPASNPCDPAAAPELRANAEIRGQVLDQNDAPQPGVVVSLLGYGRSATSGADGSFSFTALAPHEIGYELVATPDAPARGGRTRSGPLSCQQVLEDVVVPIVSPPASPVVEIAEATAPDRLFVAFGSVSDDPSADSVVSLGDCRALDDGAAYVYRAEVRRPFGGWQTALLADVPITDEAFDLQAALDDGTVTDRIGESCAASACVPFAYAHDALALAANARCAEVVGILDEGQALRLAPYDSYQVRVRVDMRVQDAADKGLPPQVMSEATEARALTLAPITLLPVAMDDDPDVSAQAVASVNITSVAPVSAGRFAIIDDGALQIMGGGGDMVEVDPAIEGGMAYDAEGSDQAISEVAENNGQAIAALPAGKWVRVWKRMSDQGGERSMVDKVCVGRTASDECASEPAYEPQFDIALLQTGAVDRFVSFDWLTAPEGSITAGPYNPPDGYLLTFDNAIVFVEHDDPTDESDSAMETMLDDSGTVSSFYNVIDFVGGLALNPVCAALAAGMGESSDGVTITRAECLDLRFLSPDIDVTDVDILKTNPEDNDPTTTFSIVADGASDVVHVARTAHLMNRSVPPGAWTIADVVDEVRVGIEPVAMLRSHIVDCGGAEPVTQPVMLVANRGSADISVLTARISQRDEDEDGLPDVTIEESAVIALPGVPERFLDDPAGPSCEAPFAWVAAEDGRLMPIDMRAGRLEIPACGEGRCTVSSRGRAQAGGVGRNADGSARVLVGGQALLGEVGFLRPLRAALPR